MVDGIDLRIGAEMWFRSICKCSQQKTTAISKKKLVLVVCNGPSVRMKGLENRVDHNTNWELT